MADLPGLLHGVLQDIAVSGVTTGAFFSASWLYERLKAAFRTHTKDRSYQENCELLEQLGQLTPHSIDGLLEKLSQQTDLPIAPHQLQELKNLLLNLSQNAAFITTQGRPSSAYFRCEHLLEQLLSNMQIVRRRGEMAGAGSEYVLLDYLGSGAYGEVWTGWNSQHPDPNWAKQHPRVFKFFTDEQAQQWLRHESNTLYTIQQSLPTGHPNLIHFYDVHVTDQEHPFLEFEYASGGSLEQWIKEDPHVRVSLNKHDVIQGITEGLAAAHEVKITHRDMKPANIVLTEGDHPHAKITDFGLAHLRSDKGASSSMQSHSSLAGTFIYMPPEAQRSFALEALDDYKQDVFALGVIWYQLCVEELERPPYNFADQLANRGLDSRTIGLISRCLAHPQDRFANAIELLNHLTDALPDWRQPADCYNVEPLFREYLAQAQT